MDTVAPKRVPPLAEWEFGVLGEFAEGDAWHGGFHLFGTFVKGAAVPAVALGELALGENAAAFDFEGFYGNRGVAAAANDVFGDAVGCVALAGLGDAVFGDADDEEDIGSGQATEARRLFPGL